MRPMLPPSVVDGFIEMRSSFWSPPAMPGREASAHAGAGRESTEPSVAFGRELGIDLEVLKRSRLNPLESRRAAQRGIMLSRRYSPPTMRDFMQIRRFQAAVLRAYSSEWSRLIFDSIRLTFGCVRWRCGVLRLNAICFCVQPSL
jgi:hypothetical protein